MIRSPSGSPLCCLVRSVAAGPAQPLGKARAGDLRQRVLETDQRPRRRALHRAGVIRIEVRRLRTPSLVAGIGGRLGHAILLSLWRKLIRLPAAGQEAGRCSSRGLPVHRNLAVRLDADRSPKTLGRRPRVFGVFMVPKSILGDLRGPHDYGTRRVPSTEELNDGPYANSSSSGTFPVRARWSASSCAARRPSRTVCCASWGPTSSGSRATSPPTRPSASISPRTRTIIKKHAEISGFPATKITEVRKMIDPTTEHSA